ncbi:MAG: PFL family protein [Eubacteriales bacterium]|nr:PFL family protein [Eubacteriales bacterium]MDD3349609.1 PFL family protein [Eubacteriales bacterium]
MLNTSDIMETITMIQEENLDIRTITMGISLLDCCDSDINRSCEKVYQKIYRCAKDLVKVGNEIEQKYGIPIINKRVSVTPIAMLCGASGGDPVEYAMTLDRVAKDIGINFIGGYSALVHKGFSPGDRELIESIPRALATTDFVCSSVNIGTTKAGINMDAVRTMGKVIREAAELTADRQCIGPAKLVVFCNAPEDNPFMAGAFHGPGEPDCVINVGVSGPGVVRAALAKAGKDIDLTEVAEIIKKTAFKITRMGQLVGTEASARLGVPFGIVDLSLAPTPAVGDSVAYILEEIGLETCGACGTTAALAMLNDAVKKGGVMASSSVGGLSGAFIPVSEDAGMIAAAKSGALTIEKLEAMTAVCSVGLDMIVIPGETPADVISGIIADEAAIGMVNSKTTAVRVIPAIGKVQGDVLEFGGLLGSGPVMKVNMNSPSVMISRGGRIPAPLQSLKN